MNRNSVLSLAALCVLVVSHLCAQTSPKPLSNDDVVAMVKGGLGENTIIGAIESQQSSFDISAMGLLHLKSSGVNPKIMDAMLTAARRKPAPEEPAAKPQAAAPMPPPLAPGLPLVNMGGKVLPAGHAQVVQTKAKASTLNALATDGALSQTLSSVTQGLATASMMHPGSAMNPTAMMAVPMVGPALMGASLFSQHHKPTVTEVWALPGQKAETALTNNQPSFEVHFANVSDSGQTGRNGKCNRGLGALCLVRRGTAGHQFKEGSLGRVPASNHTAAGGWPIRHRSPPPEQG